MESLPERLRQELHRQAAEKHRLISHGIALWTRTETEYTMARNAKPSPAKVN